MALERTWVTHNTIYGIGEEEDHMPTHLDWTRALKPGKFNVRLILTSPFFLLNISQMLCAHREPDTQSSIINLSQLDYSKLECLAKGSLASSTRNYSQQRKMENQHMLVPLDVEPVCRTWRQVAWSRPVLWTDIVLEKVSSPASNGRRGMHVLGNEPAGGSSVHWGGMVMNMDGRDQHLRRGISRSATGELGQSWTNQGEEQVAWKRWEVFCTHFTQENHGSRGLIRRGKESYSSSRPCTLERVRRDFEKSSELEYFFRQITGTGRDFHSELHLTSKLPPITIIYVRLGSQSFLLAIGRTMPSDFGGYLSDYESEWAYKTYHPIARFRCLDGLVDKQWTNALSNDLLDLRSIPWIFSCRARRKASNPLRGA
ncbi:hypothetical protein CPC08DRAFT_729184 [Agrocybe pediades]|nr:hypothetical protein CPC08DRAFT_729184 [Agrocybe pediades]